jgi:hypothetical protein
MHGLTVDNIHLDRVLAPVAHHLDRCWWYLGGAGMSFPHVRKPNPLADPETNKPQGRQDRRRARRQAMQSPSPGPRFDPEDWQRYLDESRAAGEEYARWLDDSCTYRVGKPGFFSRYAAGMDSNWQTYYASDSNELRPSSFDEVSRRFDGVWFDPPPGDLPPDICLITRDVDAGYLDLFFRDEWMFDMVWHYLDKKGMAPRPYKPLDVKAVRRG